MLARWLVVVATLAGCDRFLQLDPVENPPHCPAPTMISPDDYDDDGERNAADPCPFLPHESSHDEDGDGVPDDCDPCPELAFDDAGDLDCDGIGAACDPDDTTPNQREFYAFDRNAGLILGNATISNDQLHVDARVDSFASAYAPMPRPSDGYYETACTIHSFDASSYTELEVRNAVDLANNVNAAAGIDWSTDTFEAFIGESTTVSIGPGPISKIKMQITLTGANGNIAVTGDAMASLSGPTDHLPATAPYGITLFDKSQHASADCDYFIRIY